MRKAYSTEEYEKRKQIISDTALKLLKEKDFSNITMRELANACELAIGTLFNYFPSKELLFRSLLYDYYDAYFTEELSVLRAQTFSSFSDYKNFQLGRVAVLIEQDTLITVLSIHHAVYTISEDSGALNDKREIWAGKLIDLGRVAHEKFPPIPRDAAVRFYYFLHALLVGYNNLLKVPGMSKPPLFISDAKKETLLSAEYYLDGMEKKCGR